MAIVSGDAGMSMIDTHTHILPGMDDGSKDKTETEQQKMRAAEEKCLTFFD